MLRDVENIEDIQVIVDAFYTRATQDAAIRHFFVDVMDIDLQDHLPIIYSFWDSVLFSTATYKGNVMLKHIALHQKSSISKAHFDAWLALWENTVLSLYNGDVANSMVEKAKKMRLLIEYKIDRSGGGRVIQ